MGKKRTNISKRKPPTKEMPHKKSKTVRVSADKAFWLKSDHGQVVAVCHSISELADVIEKSPNSTYEFHTNNRNDFASWINGIFKNPVLAEKVSKAKNRKEFLEALRGEK